MIVINGEFYDSYDDWCEEILSYMHCQKESFDFGEGGLIMSSEGGEYAMYKFSILDYLNSFYDDEFRNWRKHQQQEKFNRINESRFDELSNENLNQKLKNRYDINMKYRKRKYISVEKLFSNRFYVPYWIKEDENGNQYVKYVNNTNRCNDRKNKYKRNKQTTRSYQHYCEYCEKEIVYDEETLCNSCFLDFDAEGILVFERQKEIQIMWNNDFSEYEVKDGHWWFHDYYDWEETRWNILHMKLN